MPQKIVEAAREHLPALLEGTAPSVLDLPVGRKLQKLADAMQLTGGVKDHKLSRKQHETQRLIGSLKFIEKLHPSLTLVLHRLSCVMSDPPPEAWVVACAALVRLT